MELKGSAAIQIVGATILLLIPGIATSSTLGIVIGGLTFLGALTLVGIDIFYDGESGVVKYASIIPWVVLIVGTLYWWSPMYQSIAYALIIEYPIVLQSLGMAIISVIAGSIVWKFKGPTWGTNTMMAGFIIVGILLVIGVFLVPLYTNVGMSQQVQEESVEIDELPHTSVENARIMPQRVGENLATNSLNTPQYKISNGDITFIDGTPHWSWSLTPNRLVNVYTKNQIGGVFVNQSTTKKDIIKVDDADFEVGNGMRLTDNIYWKLSRNDYWNSYQDSFIFMEDGTSYLAVPYVEHNVEFRFPFFYTVPEFGGVKLVRQEGTVEDLSPQEATESEILGGQNFYPYDLARFKVKSMAFKNGIINALFTHEDQLELAEVPGQGNDQPFTVPTEEGIEYFVATEPFGESNGVYQMWVLDARTGEPRYKHYGSGSDTLRGARKSIESIMGSPEIAPLNEVVGVEPTPLVRDGDLYWMVRVVPQSSSTITYVSFFNAETEEITHVETTNDVKAFLRGTEEIDSGGETGEEQDDETETGLVIGIEYPDGSTENITVEEGSSITIEDR
jgi:hypothetical protein